MVAGEAASCDALSETRGPFAAAQFNIHEAGAPRLQLATDRLGIRPLYYGEHEGTVYFSTALRALLAVCPALGEVADMAGQVQRAVLGFTLEAHTPYARIRVVEPGHLIEWCGERQSTHRYAAWVGDIAPAESCDSIGHELHTHFVQAVQARFDSGPAVAYLSGGLDSRCTVAALRLGARAVHTINFAPAGSADLALGALAAQALGTQHFEYDTDSIDFWDRCQESVAHWRAQRGEPLMPAVTHVATGFGGEALLAPVNITASILAAVRGGCAEQALEEYLRRFAHGLPARLLRRRWRAALPSLLRTRMHEALARCPGAEPGQQLYLWLLLNEPRGQLAVHFENLDLHRIEWAMPFLDTEVVRTALRLPIDTLLQHRFYYRWLHCFGDAVSQVPWQAYPTSLPCPIAAPAGLRNQWGEGWLAPRQEQAALEALCRTIRRHLSRPDFPGALISRPAAWTAYALTRLGWRRYDYVLSAVDTLVQQAARIYPNVDVHNHVH